MRPVWILILTALSGPLVFWGSFFFPSASQGYDLSHQEPRKRFLFFSKASPQLEPAVENPQQLSLLSESGPVPQPDLPSLEVLRPAVPEQPAESTAPAVSLAETPVSPVATLAPAASLAEMPVSNPPPVETLPPAAAVELPPAAATEEVAVHLAEPVTEPALQPGPTPVSFENFPLGPGDELTMTVWGYPELSIEKLVILPGGAVSCPLIGSVPAEGLTADALAVNLQQALAQHIPSPKVTLMLTTMRSRHFSVTGAVKKPGLYPFWNDEMTVLEAIAQAEGMLETALPAEVKVFRQGGNGEVAGVDVRQLLSADSKAGAFMLEPGDLVYVPSYALQQKVSVLGQVNLPGMYPLESGMTVVDALSRAGWIPPSGAMDRVMILRRVGEEKPEIFRINAHRAIALQDASQAPLLKPGDVVYVPEKFFSKVGNFVNMLTAGPESGSRTALRVYDVSDPR